MKIVLENIAKIKEAEIVLDGITTIAGENSTGKSTVGKVLYSFYASLYQVDKKIEKYLEEAVFHVFQTYVVFQSMEDVLSSRRCAQRLIRDYYQEDISDEDLKRELKAEKALYFSAEEQLDMSVSHISYILELADEDIKRTIIQKYLRTEFDDQIVHVNHDTGKIVFEIKEGKEEILLSEQKVKNIETDMQITSDVVYIDSPFVIDNINRLYLDEKEEHHRINIINKFNKPIDSMNPVTETIIHNRMEKLEQFWANTVPGELKKGADAESSVLIGGLKSPLHISNLATGMKTFLILKTVLENGYIKDKGVLILDEPEIHLHPEWQIYLAEMIVLLQKEFDLTVLINTHSPYFLNAIEVFSAKHQTADKCKYYLAETEGVYAKIVDVTRETDKIYQKLAKPLTELDKMLHDME